jgi:putative FmdB family regulatory protein
MPIYEYQCSDCGYELEELQTMSEPPLIKCPHCGKNTLKKLIGGGGGLIFKGSGFYQTDYKNAPKQTTNKPAGKGKGVKTEAKTDQKTDTKTESKTDLKTSESSTKKSETKTNKTENKKS